MIYRPLASTKLIESIQSRKEGHELEEHPGDLVQLGPRPLALIEDHP